MKIICRDRAIAMSETIDAELEELARAAAEDVAGSEAVERVEMRRGVDAWYRPAYHFSFLIDQRRARERPGRIRLNLMKRLLDELETRGDEHRPVLRFLNREDWDRRSDVGFG
jgi:hypothetical protein